MSAGVGGVGKASFTPTWSILGFQEVGPDLLNSPSACVLRKGERGRALCRMNQLAGKNMIIQLSFLFLTDSGQEGKDKTTELRKTWLGRVYPL